MYKILLVLFLLIPIRSGAATVFEMGLVDLNKYTDVDVKNNPYAHPAFIWLLGKLKKRTKINRITEGYPTTSRHSSAAHKSGKAIDLTLMDPTESEKICTWINELPDFQCIDEYKRDTKYKTGGHLHLGYVGI